MRILVFISVFFLSALGEAFTLKEAVSLALAKANLLVQSQAEYQKSEAAVTSARSAFLPSLDLNAAYAYNDENRGTRTSAWDSSAGILLSENLFDHGVSIYTFDLSRANRRLALLDFQRERSNTILKTIQLYFEVLRTHQVEEVQNKNVIQVEQVYKLVTSQYRQGIKPRSDFLRFQSQYQRAVLAQTSAQLDSLRALQALKVYLGLRETPAPFENYLFRPWIADTKEPVYETERRKLSLEAREYTEKLSEIENFPQLNIFGKAGYGSENYYQTGQRWNDNDKSFLVAGLTFTWNIWDWGKRSSAVKSAKLDTLKTDSQTSFDEREALARIAELEQQLKIVQKQFELSESILKIENQNYVLIERAYKEGRSSYLDFTSSLSDLLSAQTQKIQTEYQLILTAFELGHRKGYLDESIIK
jgi:outer membrane protein TolC